MRLIGFVTLAGVVAFVSAAAFGQQGAAGIPGSVAGVVTLGDTQRPAAFAKVTLTPVPKKDKAKLPKLTDKDAETNPMAAIGALMGSVTMMPTQTGLEGNFSLANVAPGDYYVMVTVPGYISAATTALMEGKTDVMADLPQVHVEPGGAARANITLERGAVLSGVVTFDNGAVVPGAMVSVESTAKKKKSEDDEPDMGNLGGVMSLAMSGGLKNVETDDRGRYRIAGLSPGEYRVKAMLPLQAGPSMSSGVMSMESFKAASPLVAYAPKTVHQNDAAKIVVKAGDDREDVDVLLNISGTHSVSGRVTSLVDHHALNAGVVTLTDTTDKQLQRKAEVGLDGTFTVTYVPSGSYTLAVEDGADTEAAPKGKGGFLRMSTRKTVKSYEDASQPVVVAAIDVTGVTVELKESAKVKETPDLGSILGGMMGATPKDKE